MVQPQRRARNPLSTAIAAVLLLIGVIGAFWVPIYARSLHFPSSTFHSSIRRESALAYLY